MHDIGLDAHSATFTVAVLDPQGRMVRCRRCATSEEALIAQISRVLAPRRLVVEESPLAQWIKTVLDPYVDELIICDPRRNRWIAQDEFNDDTTSAIKLAQLLRGGYIKPVPHPPHDAEQLRRLFYHYSDLNRQLCRFKNKLKAAFRQVGRRAAGPGVYGQQQRAEWLALLGPHQGLQHRARQLYRLLDTLEELKSRTFRTMVRSARRFDPDGWRVLHTMPGIGPVIASGYMAIIVRPERFSRENKLWRYAGLGNVRHVSDGVVYREAPSKSGNRELKWLVDQQFHSAVHYALARGGSNRFARSYSRMLSAGQNPKVARRSVSRALLSVVRAIWMKGEAYRDEHP